MESTIGRKRGKKRENNLREFFSKDRGAHMRSIGEDLEKEYLRWMGRWTKAGPKRENMKKERKTEEINSLKDTDIQTTSKDGVYREELKKNPRRQAKGVVNRMLCLYYKVGEI